jgi:hypothetical protein
MKTIRYQVSWVYQTIDKEIPKDVKGPQQQYFSNHYPNSESDVTSFLMTIRNS